MMNLIFSATSGNFCPLLTNITIVFPGLPFSQLLCVQVLISFSQYWVIRVCVYARTHALMCTLMQYACFMVMFLFQALPHKHNCIVAYNMVISTTRCASLNRSIKVHVGLSLKASVLMGFIHIPHQFRCFTNNSLRFIGNFGAEPQVCLSYTQHRL